MYRNETQVLKRLYSQSSHPGLRMINIFEYIRNERQIALMVRHID